MVRPSYTSRWTSGRFDVAPRGSKWLLSGLCLWVVPQAVRAEPPAVTAVFEIEDATQQFSEKEIEQLTDYLSARLAQTGRFVVVPRAEVKAALREQVKESYKACYDESCQIEIGKALAAQKSLVTQMIRVGSSCALTSTLLDLAKAASEAAATTKASCTQDDLVVALDRIVEQLARERAPPVVAPITPPPPPAPSPEGRLSVDSQPSGATVRINGQPAGKTPTVFDHLRPGQYRVEIQLTEHLGYETWATIDAQRQTHVTATLTPEAAYEAAARAEGRASVWRWLFGTVAAATALGGTVTLAIAPTESSIRQNEYDAYLLARTPAERRQTYAAVEDAVNRQNTLTLVGWSLLGTAVASTTLAIILGTTDDVPTPSVGETSTGAQP